MLTRAITFPGGLKTHYSPDTAPSLDANLGQLEASASSRVSSCELDVALTGRAPLKPEGPGRRFGSSSQPVQALEEVSLERATIHAEGLVQGVGFRPFVYRLAAEEGLTGAVWNGGRGVWIEVEGPWTSIVRFRERLVQEAPPMANITALHIEKTAPRGDHSFLVEPSRREQLNNAQIAPDIATCKACLDELFDPADRRFNYPFISCSHCGPRYTIITGTPYDRHRTTMAAFAMCAECAREYAEPSSRRFHAQPIACFDCGPQLTLLDANQNRVFEDPIATCVSWLKEGSIVAIKGLGGYHLAVDAANNAAVARLRTRKHRDHKPFALMVPTLEAAHQLAELSPPDLEALTSPSAPIVIAKRKPEAPVAPAVAPGSDTLGLLLPYTPLHHLLTRSFGGTLVFTSANLSDEPLVYRDTDLTRLAEVADGFLTHDRAIHLRADDSVVRVLGSQVTPIRRARGLAPRPLRLPMAAHRGAVLAVGGELKSTVCLAVGSEAHLSPHLGDLEYHEAFVAFTEAIDQLCTRLETQPAVIAFDLHHGYASAQWAKRQPGVELIAVQHHHAHVAACLAEHGHLGPAIGVAYDGLGYGLDGTLWGGEILLLEGSDFERVGHWSTTPMPGGVAAIREPWRMAASYLQQAFKGDSPKLPVTLRHAGRWGAVLELTRQRELSPLTSSMGRLFDAAAAILNVRDRSHYEGQAAVELEALAYRGQLTPPKKPAKQKLYELEIGSTEQGWVLPGATLIQQVAIDALSGTDSSVVALRFHQAVAEATVRTCELVRKRTGVETVALSGGVFQNQLLLKLITVELATRGFTPLAHRLVPPNDGGLSLGQAWVAAKQVAANRP